MDHEYLQVRRAARARERKQRARRRRAVAIGAVAVVVVLVAVIAFASAGGSSRTSSVPVKGRRATARRAGPRSPAGHPARPGPPRPARLPRAVRPGRGASTAAALGKATGRPGATPVPVLMYHVIAPPPAAAPFPRSEEHTSELQSLRHLVCRLLLV